jgi:hypothetical protein
LMLLLCGFSSEESRARQSPQGRNMICLWEAMESSILGKRHYELLFSASLTSLPLFVNLIYIQFIVSWRGKQSQH